MSLSQLFAGGAGHEDDDAAAQAGRRADRFRHPAGAQANLGRRFDPRRDRLRFGSQRRVFRPGLRPKGRPVR